jgi:hypothetical protein
VSYNASVEKNYSAASSLVRFALKQNLAYLYPQNLDVPFFTFTGMFLRDRDDLPIFCEISKESG